MLRHISILFSESDTKWEQVLVKHFNVLLEYRDDIEVNLWSVPPTPDHTGWVTGLIAGIQRSAAIVLLMSNNFLDSPFIRTPKIRNLLKSSQESKTPVFLVMVSDCQIRKYPWLKSLPTFPVKQKRLSQLDFNDAENILAELVEDILKKLELKPTVTEGILNSLVLNGIGPIKNKLSLEAGQRLNIIAGDNGLGKSFLLECIWWVFSGDWARKPAYPHKDRNVEDVYIQYDLMSRSGNTGELKRISFNRKKHNWIRPKNSGEPSGVVIYTGFDGTFAVWDPVSVKMSTHGGYFKAAEPLVIPKESVFDGIRKRKTGKQDEKALINGLIEDWKNWEQDKNNPGSPFHVFIQILEILSTPSQEKLKPGVSQRVPGDTRYIPSIEYPYGTIPITYCAASVQRIISLAYIILWAWVEHRTRCSLANIDTYKSLIILVDELECHLHPQWQRTIFSSLVKVKDFLDNQPDVQLFITTHSPMIIASMEPFFDQTQDKLFLLDIDNAAQEVTLKEESFLPLGTMDNWFTSDLFKLREPRSRESEEIIRQAAALQDIETPSTQEIDRVHRLLRKTLGAFDPFWPRWLFFIKQHGVEL